MYIFRSVHLAAFYKNPLIKRLVVAAAGQLFVFCPLVTLVAGIHPPGQPSWFLNICERDFSTPIFVLSRCLQNVPSNSSCIKQPGRGLCTGSPLELKTTAICNVCITSRTAHLWCREIYCKTNMERLKWSKGGTFLNISVFKVEMS